MAGTIWVPQDFTPNNKVGHDLMPSEDFTPHKLNFGITCAAIMGEIIEVESGRSSQFSTSKVPKRGKTAR